MFGETLVFRRLLDDAETPAVRLALLAENIEGSIATVFRQVAMNRSRTPRTPRGATEGELSRRAHRRAVGRRPRRSCSATPSRSPTATASWWSYVPHFIGTPGYVYAYAYGQLLALSVYGRYLEEGEAFVPALPRAAARRRLASSPEELAAIAGLDLADPGFWARRAGPRARSSSTPPRRPPRRCWPHAVGPQPG